MTIWRSPATRFLLYRTRELSSPSVPQVLIKADTFCWKRSTFVTNRCWEWHTVGSVSAAHVGMNAFQLDLVRATVRVSISHQKRITTLKLGTSAEWQRSIRVKDKFKDWQRKGNRWQTIGWQHQQHVVHFRTHPEYMYIHEPFSVQSSVSLSALVATRKADGIPETCVLVFHSGKLQLEIECFTVFSTLCQKKDFQTKKEPQKQKAAH